MIKPLTPYKEFCPTEGMLSDKNNCDKHPLSHNFVLEWKSKTQPKAVIVCIHAMFLSAKAFSSFGNSYVEKGFDVYSLDLRGFGQKRDVQGFTRVDFAKCSYDIEQFLLYIKRSYPSLPIYLVGESMGGAISLKVASSTSNLVDGIICSAPAWRLFSVPKITYFGLMDKLNGEPGRAAQWVLENATSCPELQNYWRNEGSTRLKLSIMEAYAYLKLMESTPKHASQIKSIPALVIQGLKDKLSKPTASAGIFKQLNTDKKQFLIACHKEHVVLEENQLTQEVSNHLESWINYHLEENNAPEDSTSSPVHLLGNSNLSSEKQEKIEELKSIASR